MTWLVTGGAGYIGSHVVRAMEAAGQPTVVIDDLSTGSSSHVLNDVPIVKESLLTADLVTLLEENKVTGVMHLAAYKYAGKSVSEPLTTYEANVAALTRLLKATVSAGVDKFVFASSAAVYGTPVVERVDETTSTDPTSPYGRSKRMGEQILADCEHAYGLRQTTLRYFNVIGSGEPELYDASPYNLLPATFDLLASGEAPRISGTDYPTPDGTCVRDYVHVADVALAHVETARRLAAGQTVERVYNLGSGHQTSVRDMMNAINGVTKSGITPVPASRRPGDPARIIADPALASRDLGWATRYTIEEMVASAWAARRHRQQLGPT